MSRTAHVLSLFVVLGLAALGGCADTLPDDLDLEAYTNEDGELIPPDDIKADAVQKIERALINRDNGVIGSVQLSYRSTIKLATQAGIPCDETAVLMTAIARQESAFRVTVAGPPNYNGTIDYGVWQVNNVTGREFGYTVSQLKTARRNAEAMVKIKDRQGLRAWAAYSKSRYKKFMPYAQEAFDTYHCE